MSALVSRNLLRLGGVLLLAIAVVGVFVGCVFARHNFHVVSPGQAYRSAQMNATTLTNVIAERGIKSILNLRGIYPEGWYQAETNTSKQLGVVHYDFELDANTELKDSEMDQIVAILGNAPKPVLFHCKTGADRTGLVGALYLYSIEGKSPALARRELNVFSGHIPYLFWHQTVAMDRSFDRYVERHAQIPGGKVKNTSGLSKQENPPPAMAEHMSN